MSAGTDLLTALGQAYRDDWSGFDGRTLRDELDKIAGIIEAEMRDDAGIPARIEEARMYCGLCRKGGSHFRSSCDLYGCNKETS